ncbi:PREDICTED: zinc finger BED domain-containing protein DAYSLEEPER-like [Lupinus angustifolius]|uniref:zinc finger BED domain-containing protein DAYSLEEPER-like n=1 Tax=Lupinus angustifolius TaxID=3871 RepID=UPI00092E2B94|nr:PREDICTED: zinc finger BED domain-containing protein DAYSLEEPER-like [Lupinus angustifolius]
MALLEFYFDKLYDHDACTQVSKIRELCYDLVSDYQQSKICSESSLLLNTASTNDEPLDEYDVFIERRRETRSSSVKTELDHYLEEDVIKRTPDFDILNWWKTNGIMYPTLQAIAKDLLAIPISIVASESAFSTSGRILSLHRSRLNWTTLEALMCARSWLWSAENAGNLNSSLAQEYATVLNEMESDDEAEVMNNSLSYHIED